MASEKNNKTDYSNIPNLKARILLPLATSIAVFLIVFMLTLRYYHNAAINEVANKATETVDRAFKQSIIKDGDFMHEAIEILESDESMRLALKKKDRQALSKKAMTHFKRMNEDHNITHFYFHDEERTNIIRLHKPSKSGDTINRHTTLNAERTDATAYGIELGPLGTFTLRVVDPWYYRDELAGYIELGKEVEQIIINVQEVTKTDIYILIEKEFLVKERWETGMQMMGRIGDWDLLPTSALINRSINNETEMISKELIKWEKSSLKQNLNMTVNDRNLVASFIPLNDAAQRKIGKIMILHDITEKNLSAKYATIVNATAGLSLAGLLILIFYAIALGAEKKMRMAQDKLLEEGQRREAMNEEHFSQLKHLALHDALTKLPNRNLLHDRIEQTLKASKRRKECNGLIVLEILRLHEINDTLGHRNVDFLLQLVGARVTEEFRETDTVARLSTESLGVLLPNIQRALLPKIINKVSSCFETPFVIDDFNLSLEISVGVAFSPEHATDADTFIQRADVANRLAKKDSALYAIYDPEREPFSKQHLTLMADLRSALNSDELYLLYQPKIDVKTGKISAAEALIRWQHPERGLISPDDFIPLAENTGLIHPLTQWVLKEAINQQVMWEKDGLNIHMSINLSARNIHDADFPHKLEELLKETGVNPHSLIFEITENVIVTDPVFASEMLSTLKGLGISISIDDFGKGYSSLSYLSTLPVDELKVDKGFVMGMNKNNNDAIIVRSTIDLGRNLGLQVVAEGVEDKESLEKLTDMGCDVAQGYLISKPITSDEFTKFFKDSAGKFKFQ